MAHDVKKDYYAILGVDRSASDEQVRDAFKKMARKHHPDKNPGKKDAEERFKLINEAYNTLGDATKRGAYDYDRRNAATSDLNNNMTSGTSSSSTGYSSSYAASNSKPNYQGQSRYSSDSRYSSSNAGTRFTDTDFSDWRREYAKASRSFDDEQHGEAESRTEDGKKSENKKSANSRERAKRTKKDAQFGSFFNDMPFKNAFFSEPSFAFSDFDEFMNGEFDDVFERTFVRTPFKESAAAESDENNDDAPTDVQFGAQARAKARREQKDTLVRCKYCAGKMNVVELCEHEPKCSMNPSNIREEADRREERRRATGLFGDAETINTNSTFNEFVDMFFRSAFPHGRAKFQSDGFFDFDFKDSDPDWRKEHEATINRIRRDRERTATYDSNTHYASYFGSRPRPTDADTHTSASDTSRTRYRKTASGKESGSSNDAQGRTRNSHSRGAYATYDKPNKSDEQVFVRGMSTGSSRADLGGGCARCRAAYGEHASFACSCGVKTTR